LINPIIRNHELKKKCLFGLSDNHMKLSDIKLLKDGGINEKTWCVYTRRDGKNSI